MKTAYVIYCDSEVTAIASSLEDAKAAVKQFQKEDPGGLYSYQEKDFYSKE